MPTKTSPSRRSSSRASKATRARKPAARTPGEAQAAPKAKRPPKTPVRQILSPHARDALGIFLVVVSLLGVLGIWFGAAGPVGGFLTWLSRGAFGIAAYVFPLIGAYWGIVLLRDTAREDRVRMFIGFAILVAGALGTAVAPRRTPAPTDGYDAVAGAGGVLGAAPRTRSPRVISPIGAAIVCLGLVVLGLLIFTGTPIAAVWTRTRDFFTAADVEDAEPDEPRSARRSGSSRSRCRRPRRSSDGSPGSGRPSVSSSPRRRGRRRARWTRRRARAARGGRARTSRAVSTAARRSARRTVETNRRPLPAAAARPAPRGPALERPTRADEAQHADGPRAHVRTRSASTRTSPAAHRGPTVTMYEVEVAAGTKVNKVLVALERHRVRARDARTSGSSRRSPASRRSASRSRTSTATS